MNIKEAGKYSLLYLFPKQLKTSLMTRAIRTKGIEARIGSSS